MTRKRWRCSIDDTAHTHERKMATTPANRGTRSVRPGERDLCERLRLGDKSALDELLKREWQGLVGYAEQFTGTVDDAEEAAQRAFVRIWRSRKRLDPERSVRAMLFRTVRNLTIDLQRQRASRQRGRDRLKQRVRRRPATPYERMRERELRGAIEELVEDLSPRRKEAFVLCRLNGLSHREAADVMELSPQTVSNHVTAALKQIRAALAPHLD